MAEDLEPTGKLESRMLSWRPMVIDGPIEDFEPRHAFVEPYRPDTIADGCSTDWFTVRAASTRGYAHRIRSVPRQDDLAIGLHETSQALVIAVADGVSGAEKSHVGSTLACGHVVEALLHQLNSASPKDLNWDEAVRGAAWNLVEYAHLELGQPADAQAAARLLATTLVVSVVWPDPPEGGSVAVVSVGDSGVWILRDKRYVRVTDSKFAPNEAAGSSAVTSLPRVPAVIEPIHADLGADDVLLIGTDGFGDPLGDGEGLVGQAFADSLLAVPSALEFAYLVDFSGETFDDDRTLVAIWPRRVERAGHSAEDH
jgi:serine/threonine protein phosphatase PrpC